MQPACTPCPYIGHFFQYRGRIHLLIFWAGAITANRNVLFGGLLPICNRCFISQRRRRHRSNRCLYRLTLSICNRDTRCFWCASSVLRRCSISFSLLHRCLSRSTWNFLVGRCELFLGNDARSSHH